MATLKDVAEKAGVSIATVSRVFNFPDKVKPDTKSRVQQAVKELDYKMSRVAKRLRSTTGRAQMIGLIIPDIQNPFFADIARGVESVSYDNDYGLLFGLSNEDRTRQKIAMETLASESVDGVIVPPVRDSNDDIINMINKKIPIVCFDRRLNDLIVDTVICDNECGAYMAIKHLIERGHRRIGFIGGIPNISSSEQREKGYKKAHKEFGLKVNLQYVREGQSTIQSGEEIAKHLLLLDEPPSALFAANNLMTLGVIDTINELGLTIPDDVSLVGFDDAPWAKAINPGITVVRQPSYQQGVTAADMLLKRIKEPDRPKSQLMLQPRLIIRGSTREI